MTYAEVLNLDLAYRRVQLVADGDQLRVSAPSGELTEHDRRRIAENKPALLALARDRQARANRPRWTAEDEAACSARCRGCRQAIAWGEVTYEFGSFERKPKWMALNPNSMPHECNGAKSTGGGRL